MRWQPMTAPHGACMKELREQLWVSFCPSVPAVSHKTRCREVNLWHSVSLHEGHCIRDAGMLHGVNAPGTQSSQDCR